MSSILDTHIYIYTQEFFLDGKLKRFAKRFLGRDFGGPRAVERSLTTGLSELGQSYFLNKYPTQPGVACVLNGTRVLKWAIEQKSRGKFSKIVAGPNIVVSPQDNNRLALDPGIDAYILPSQWNADWWINLEPDMSKALRVWPAGVKDGGSLRRPDGTCLIYKKTVPEALCCKVVEILQQLNISYEVLQYGSFSPEQYVDKLRKTNFVIYLTEHESQGLALHEAWMADVPTLVWYCGGFTNNGKFMPAKKASAPYLDDEAGMTFSGEEDIGTRLVMFIGKLGSFAPRRYSLANFTDKSSAENYLKIVKEVLDQK